MSRELRALRVAAGGDVENAAPAGRMSLRPRRALGDISNSVDERVAHPKLKRQRTGEPAAAAAATNGGGSAGSGNAGARRDSDGRGLPRRSSTNRHQAREAETPASDGSSEYGSPAESAPPVTPTKSKAPFVVPPPLVGHHDAGDLRDVRLCAEYVHDMYLRYKQLESQFAPTMYMHMQTDINPKMRAILVDWIVEVHLKFKLAPPTLYLACHIVDRYCMVEPVRRNRLQLVGVTALLVACKYEEIYPPEVQECAYITDNAYTATEVIEMELSIVRCLHYRFTVPTTWTFLTRVLKVARATQQQFQRACYFSERCLQEHDMLGFQPSLVAAAVVYLARLYDIEDVYAWALQEFCQLEVDQLRPCCELILSFLAAEPITASRRHLVAVKKKFLLDKFLAVSVEELPTLPVPSQHGTFS